MIHSFEVEQIARSFARQLGLNQDLCATIAIGHDIGHAPFGHLGQDVLNEVFSDIGGFEHNHQALRLVDTLESPYLEHPGLNLMFETREGLLKHCSPTRAKLLGPVAARHLHHGQPPLEVQAVDLADQIAYLHGDLEDALDKGILLPSALMDTVPGFKSFWAMAQKAVPGLKFPSDTDFANPDRRTAARAAIGEVWRRMLSDAVEVGAAHSRANIEKNDIRTLADVRAQVTPMICLDPDKASAHRDLRKFSRAFIYEHPSVVQHRVLERSALTSLCEAASQEPDRFGLSSSASRLQVLDWVASLTDRAVMSWAMEPTPLPTRGRSP